MIIPRFNHGKGVFVIAMTAIQTFMTIKKRQKYANHK